LTGDTLLSIRNLPLSGGRAVPAFRLDIDLSPGQALVLLAENGHGRSTLMRQLAGLAPHEGEIAISGVLAPPDVRARIGMGLVLCPQGRRLFPDMTVTENLLMGAYLRDDSRQIASDMDAMAERIPWLRTWGGRRARNLSGGEQQLLAVARALMAAPRILLLDEPSVGLSPSAIRQLAEWLRCWSIVSEAAMVVAEQNTAFAALIGTRFGVLHEHGLSWVADPRTFLEGEVPPTRTLVGSSPQ
jgi:branched-chain amino acid transport system ATP-binding protein